MLQKPNFMHVKLSPPYSFYFVVTNSQSSFLPSTIILSSKFKSAFQNFQQLYQYNHLIVYYETIQPLLKVQNGAVLKAQLCHSFIL